MSEEESRVAVREIPCDEGHDVLIIVPTVSDPSVVLPTYTRLVRYADGLRVRVILSLNSDSPDNVITVKRRTADIGAPAGGLLDTIDAGEPIGFGASVNRALEFAAEHGGIPKMVVIHNDDAHVVEGWLQGMLDALETDQIELWGEPPLDPKDPAGAKRKRPAAEYGRIGLVGPTTTTVAGCQQVRLSEDEARLSLDQYADIHRQRYKGRIITCDFLSGFCLGVARDALEDLGIFDDDGKLVGVFDERYEIAGYEDNDLCFRAWRAGWRMVIASDVYLGHIGHATFDRLFPDHMRGMRNRLTYYRRWRDVTQKEEQRIVATYRFLAEVPNDLHMLKGSLLRVAQVFDGVTVLLTGNPLEIISDEKWPQLRGAFTETDHEMLKACHGAGPLAVAAAFKKWIEAFYSTVIGGRPMDVKVKVWEGEFHERHERNESIELAESLDPDWIISIDSDELLEDRITRDHIDRWIRHPDPMVSSLNFCWLNHWDSPRLIRQDIPWGHDLNYAGGMNGQRMWRVCRKAPRRIIAGADGTGLHCGNSPDTDIMVKRAVSLRIRHLGYLKLGDRLRKFARYARQDPNPNPTLTGNAYGYGHIIDEEGMKISAFVEENGIGFHCLLHEGETADDLARWLDQMHGAFDRAVLVWTGEWDELDKMWTKQGQEDGSTIVADGYPGDIDWVREDELPADGSSWPKTGPTREMAEVAELFGCEWVHHPLEDDLSAARNAGISALHGTKNLGWAFFVDMDEWFEDGFTGAATLRRMAEVADSWGWLFKAVNYHVGTPPTYSESVRMSRLDPNGFMRMRGRVHESFEAVRHVLKERGMRMQLRYAPDPMMIHHRGLALSDDKMDAKFLRYRNLLVKELEDRPDNPGSWVSLGLTYENDGYAEEAQECYRRAVACSRGEYLPFHTLAMYYLQMGSALLEQAINLLPRNHPKYPSGAKLLEILAKLVPHPVILGSARKGKGPALPKLPLPPFELPEHAQKFLDTVTGDDDDGNDDDDDDWTDAPNFVAPEDCLDDGDPNVGVKAPIPVADTDEETPETTDGDAQATMPS